MPRILLVDDSKDFLRAMSRLLFAHGYRPDAASSGYDALCMLRNHEFDLVVLDLTMPGMDGLRVIEEARKLPGKLPPFIICTGGQSALPAEVPPDLVCHVIEKGTDDPALILQRIEEVAGPGQHDRVLMDDLAGAGAAGSGTTGGGCKPEGPK